MKLIVAIIKPHQLDEVLTALHEIDVPGVTISEVRGHGRQRGHTEIYRGAEYEVDFIPKVRVEVLVNDDDEGRVHDTIMDAARTGKIGDGKIWIIELATVTRIRTGQLGPDAL